METSGRLSDIDKIISEIEALRSSTRLRLSGQSEAPKADHGQFSPTFARNVVNVGDLSEDPFSEDSIIFSCPPAAAREEVPVDQPSDPTFIAPFPSLETQEAANSKRRGSWPGVAPYDDEDTIGRRDGLDTSALLEVTGSSTEEARPRLGETQPHQERMSIPGAVDDLDTSVPIARSHQEEVEGSRPGPATIVPNLDETQEVETHDQQAPEAGEPAVADSLAAPNEETAAGTADAESSLAAEGQVAAAATPAAAMQEKEVQETPAVMTEEAAGCADEDAAVHTEATPEVADVQEMSAMVEDAFVAKASEEHPADISVAKPEDMAAVTFANVPAMQEEQASRQEPPDMVDEPVDSADAKPEDIAAVTDDVPAAVGEEEDAAAHQDMPALDNSVRLSAQAAPDTATEVPAVEEEAARQEFAEMVDEPVDSADAKPEHIAAVTDDVPALEEAAKAVGEEEDAAAHQDMPALDNSVRLSAQAAPDTATEVPAVEEEAARQEFAEMVDEPVDSADAKPEHIAAVADDVPAVEEASKAVGEEEDAAAHQDMPALDNSVRLSAQAAPDTATEVPAVEEEAARQEFAEMVDEPVDSADAKPEHIAAVADDVPAVEEAAKAVGEEEDATAHQDVPALENTVRLSAQAPPDTVTEVAALEEEGARQEPLEAVDEPVDFAAARPKDTAAVTDDVPAAQEAAQAVGEEEDAAAHQDVPALESTVHLSAQAAPDTVTEVPAVEEEEPLDMIEKPLDFAAAKPEDTAALVDVPAAQEEDMVDQAAGAAKELLVLEETVNITPEAAQETAMADEPEDAVAVTVTDIPSQEEPGDAAGADAEPAVADAPANAGEAVPAQEERVKDLHQRVEGLEKLVTDLQASLAAKERALQEWEQVQVPDPEEDLPTSPSAMRRELVTLRQQNVTQSALLGILRSKFETSSAKAEEEPGAANRSVKKDQELVDLLGALQMKLSDIKADKGEASALKTADFGKSGTLVEKGADEGVSKPEAELSTPQTRTRRVASVAERALSRSPSPRALPQQALSRSPSPRPLPQQ
ncbi:unnamed protein product, partial [Effrenium voratum]